MTTLAGRFRQTAQFITAWVRPVQDSMARDYLTEMEYGLFMRMARPERQHHLRVASDLLRQGPQHPALMKAALLHDVGKTRFRFGLVARVLVVLVKMLLPAFFEKWSNTAPPYGWKRAFVVSAHHPAWSADMAAQVGTNALTLELIRRHQTYMQDKPQTEADHLLLLLQAADDRS